MIRTLHTYITGELIRIALLTLAALTLIMTVVFVVEPLRKEGLSIDHAMGLVMATMPYVLSLAVPVASLFSATIVYGRFAQDNELLACRASGIGMITLLRPALVLGAVATVISLFLNNYVAPAMLVRAEEHHLSFSTDARAAVFQQLGTRGYVRWGNYHIHADAADSNAGVLGGVVFVDASKPDDLAVTVASRAEVDFATDEQGRPLVLVSARDPVAFRSGRFGLVDAGRTDNQFPMESAVRDKPAWSDWGKLLAMLQRPELNLEISRALVEQRRRVAHETFLRELAETIAAGKPYRLSRQAEHFDITAQGAALDAGSSRVALTAPSVRHTRDGAPGGSTLTGQTGAVIVSVSRFTRQSLVSIAVTAEGRELSAGAEIPLPPEAMRRAQSLTLEDLTARIDSYSSDPRSRRVAAVLQDRVVPELVRDIVAELHSRVSYGSSCFLMVALGAALGLMFRGGHFISAFALSMIPAGLVIVMLLMGKQMVGNIKIDLWKGVTAIWGGVIVLLGATIVVYARLMRR